MSFTIVEQCTPRLNRSELAVPGSNPKFLEKATESTADVIFLDLEDAVAPDDKEKARKNIIEALNDLDWSGKTLSVRINGLDTHYMYRDVVDILEQAPGKLDLIMIPKAGTAADIYAVDMLVTQIEAATKVEKRIGFELIIETALGMMNVDELAASSRRLESLHFGVADYAASTKARTTVIGGPNKDYHVLTDPDGDGNRDGDKPGNGEPRDHWYGHRRRRLHRLRHGNRDSCRSDECFSDEDETDADPDGDGNRDVHWGDMWHYPVARMVVAARAHGLRPIDGPFGDFSDPDGFNAQGNRSATLGCEGKWAIHPSQVELANNLFSPSDEDVTKAQRIIEAMEQAQKEGKGAVALDGRLIDIASIKQAEVMVRKAEQIKAAG